MAVPNRVCIIGLDEQEVAEIQAKIKFGVGILSHQALPHIVVKDGQLFVDSRHRAATIAVTSVVFHAIYEDDLDFLAALALWGGPCLPNPQGMMDLRLRLPGLVRALKHTQFGEPLRGYVSAGATFDSERQMVAKWGNWHCGKNKERFKTAWTSEYPCIVEDFIPGDAVRIVLIGDNYWQVKLEGDSWLKSIHAPNANFMEVDLELLADTQRIARAFDLDLVANDYIVTAVGTKHLLEVNHIPNVTRFPEIWQVYRDYTVNWIDRNS